MQHHLQRAQAAQARLVRQHLLHSAQTFKKRLKQQRSKLRHPGLGGMWAGLKFSSLDSLQAAGSAAAPAGLPCPERPVQLAAAAPAGKFLRLKPPGVLHLWHPSSV